MAFRQPSSKQGKGGGKLQIQELNVNMHNQQQKKDVTGPGAIVKEDVKPTPTLSKGVMTMKFMKRKTDADLELVQEAEKRRKMLDNAWISEGNDTKHNEQDSLVTSKEDNDLMASLPGRRSFGGFNKAVERHYEQMMDEKRFDKASERASKNSVSDTEMLNRYETLIGLPRGPNQGMRPKKEKSNEPEEKEKLNKDSNRK